MDTLKLSTIVHDTSLERPQTPSFSRGLALLNKVISPNSRRLTSYFDLTYFNIGKKQKQSYHVTDEYWNALASKKFLLSNLYPTPKMISLI